MSAITLTNENFDSEVMKSDKPVLIDFWATWCGPCRMVSPLIDEIADENPSIKVGKVNVDEQAELAARFGVSQIPTLLVMRGGKPLRTAVGARSKTAILELVTQ